MKNEIEVLRAIAYYLMDEMDFTGGITEDDILILEHAVILIEKKCIAISFDINCEAREAAIITQLVMEASRKFRSFHIEIYEPYLTAYDENGVCTGTLWGDDITKYKETHI